MRNLIFLILSIFVTNLFASSIYVKSDIQITNSINGEKLALITKGTKVEVIKSKGDYSLIEIKGWSYEDEPNEEIFYKDGVTVVLASILKSQLKNRKILQSKEDDYEEIWIENSITGWIESKFLTKEFKKLWIKESQLASTRCSACHEAPSAESHFAGEFPSLLDSMAEQAGLSDDEKMLLINFYQKKNIYKK